MPKKLKLGDPSVMPDACKFRHLQSCSVLYVTRKKKEKYFWFTSLGQMVEFYTIKFCITFGRTILVTSGIGKKLTNSHDYSGLFPQEQRRLKTSYGHAMNQNVSCTVIV